MASLQEVACAQALLEFNLASTLDILFWRFNVRDRSLYCSFLVKERQRLSLLYFSSLTIRENRESR